jgi:HEAT repeat protein
LLYPWPVRLRSTRTKMLLSASVFGLVAGASEELCRRIEQPVRSRDESEVAPAGNPGWPPTDAFTHDGMLDRARTETKPEGTRRVLCLGDGVTLGSGLLPGQSYPSRLQGILDGRGPGVEVMTLAEETWATGQERTAYETVARRYSPDLVLLGISLDDLQHPQDDQARPSGWLSGLYRHSALLRLLVNPETPLVEARYDILFSEIRRLRAGVEGDGARLALVVFPFSDQVSRPPTEVSPQPTIHDFCAREGLRCLDPLPQLEALGEAAFRPAHPLHLGAEGSARAAGAIASSDVVPAAWTSSAAVARALRRAPPLEPGREDARRLELALSATDSTLRRQAAWGLGRIGSEARDSWPSLAARLDDPEEAVRLEAVRALGRLRSAEARAVLFRAAADRSDAVRWAATDALATIGLEASDSTTLADLLGATDPYLRAFGAWALGEGGKQAAWTSPSLTRRLEDVDPDVRAVAATAIGRLGSAEAAVPALTLALQDHDERVRREAADALGRMGSAARAALAALDAARGDASEEVRQAASVAVTRVTTAEHQ